MSKRTSDTEAVDHQQLIELETNPAALERHYRDAPQAFEEAFAVAFAERPNAPIFQAWHARLSFDGATLDGATDKAALAPHATRSERRLLLWVVGLVLVAGTLAKLPDLVRILGGVLSEDFFYPRNIGFLVLPMLATYLAYAFARSQRTVLALAALFGGSCLYINLLPEDTADTVVLALLHMPLWLWGLLGVAYVGTYRQHAERRLAFLRYNGEMLIYTALILIAGGILSGLTILLFQLIAIDVGEWYMENVAVYGVVGAPIVATLLATTRYGVSQRIAPVIARIFTPLPLLTLIVYLGALLTRGMQPFADRDTLLVLNMVLLAVLALIVFSISEQRRTSRFTHYVGAGLLGVAVVLDVIALVAIATRLFDGLTPNRLAVLGANVLILGHLALLLYRYVQLLKGNDQLEQIERAMTGYLGLYVGWAALVTFGFPLFFGFS
ncbi:MAG: hypothetical protein GVY12_07290 [Bacteroidetes bacterium]|jgi:hypothetical protein|nr:hypothetical protein [Bacteroidota bacterium]